MESLIACLVVRVMSAPNGGNTETVISIRRLWIERGRLRERPDRREPLLLGAEPFERHGEPGATHSKQLQRLN
jgi:hypothetical protein